jgi:hypothetical protein
MHSSGTEVILKNISSFHFNLSFQLSVSVAKSTYIIGQLQRNVTMEATSQHRFPTSL